MGIDMKAMLRSLEEAQERRKGGDPARKDRIPNDMTEMQQADALLESYTYYNTRPVFKPGDFVRYRAEMSDIIRNYNKLHVVYEVFPEREMQEIDSDNEGSPTLYRRYNLIIGLCDPRAKGSILKYVADSRDLEPWPEGERLKRQGTA